MMIMKWKDIIIKTMNKNMSLILNWIRLIFLLFAGASANETPASDGALTFDVDVTPSWTSWNIGSAFIYIILFAGAGVTDTSSWGGAFTFDLNGYPLWAYWNFGSAI